jgi:hypothetical protein
MKSNINFSRIRFGLAENDKAFEQNAYCLVLRTYIMVLALQNKDLGNV